MSNYHLSEVLVRLQLAQRYDEASYRRAVRRPGRGRPWHPDRRRADADDLTRLSP